MSTVTVKDGARINYRDCGTRQPAVFSNDWPLCAEALEGQMFFGATRGYRCMPMTSATPDVPIRRGMATIWTPTPPSLGPLNARSRHSGAMACWLILWPPISTAGVLRNQPVTGPRPIRYSDIKPARRRRPDRAGRKLYDNQAHFHFGLGRGLSFIRREESPVPDFATEAGSVRERRVGP